MKQLMIQGNVSVSRRLSEPCLILGFKPDLIAGIVLAGSVPGIWLGLLDLVFA